MFALAGQVRKKVKIKAKNMNTSKNITLKELSID